MTFKQAQIVLSKEHADAADAIAERYETNAVGDGSNRIALDAEARDYASKNGMGPGSLLREAFSVLIGWDEWEPEAF